MNKKLSALFLTAMFTMLFSVAVMAAPGKVTGVKQTGASGNSITVEWNSQLGADYYIVQISEDQANWYLQDEYGTSSPKDTLYNLSSGKTYYVRVIAYTGSYLDSSDRNYGAYSDVITVATAPPAVQKVYQTSATTSSVTIGWDGVSGATSYQIYEYTNGNRILKGETTGNTFTISGLKNTEKLPFSWIEVYSVRSSDSYKAVQSNDGIVYASGMRLVSSKVKNVAVRNYWSNIKEVSFGFDNLEFADGFQYQLYEKNGKKPISSGYSTSYYSTYLKNLKANKFYKLRVRAYVKVNGNNVFGEWSDATYFSYQPKVFLKRSGSALKLSWKKVKGATNYTVYMSTSKNTGYKKIKTLKGTKIKVSKFKKKKLNKKKTYYVYVIANTKVGKKTYKSDKQYYYYLY